MKTEKFKIVLIDKYNLFIPAKYAENIINDEKRAKLKINFNDKEIEFFAAFRKDKASGDYKIMFSNAKQKELGASFNDELTIQLFKDNSKYGVEMPEELDAVLLSDYDAFQIFENLTSGKQRSIIYHIKRLKGVQKKVDQALLLCENLKCGNTQNKELFKPI